MRTGILWVLLLAAVGSVYGQAVKDPMPMVLVEGGNFTMGGSNSKEDVSHQVTVSPFMMSATEVSRVLYYEVTGNGPDHDILGSHPDGREATFPLPMEMVTWNEAVKFCNLLSQQAGLAPVYAIVSFGLLFSATPDWNASGYRLPTEAEWEFAARGGNKSKGYKYAGSNAPGDVAWSKMNSGGQPHPAGMKAPNELGLYDMSGNVREWCWDLFGPYTGLAQVDPRGPTAGDSRVVRGGGWDSEDLKLTTTYRDGAPPKFVSNGRGFRVVRRP